MMFFLFYFILDSLLCRTCMPTLYIFLCPSVVLCAFLSLVIAFSPLHFFTISFAFLPLFVHISSHTLKTSSLKCPHDFGTCFLPVQFSLQNVIKFAYYYLFMNIFAYLLNAYLSYIYICLFHYLLYIYF